MDNKKSWLVWPKLKTALFSPIGQCFWIAFALEFLVEVLSRRSLWKGLVFLVTDPLVFLYNLLIIMTTLSISMLVRRRVFVLTLVSSLWIIVGIVDFILLQFRTTPFTAVDITLLSSTLQIIPHYLNVFHLILIGAGILLLAAGLIFLYRKAPKYTGTLRRIRSLIFCVMLTLSVFGITHIYVFAGLVSENFGNLADAYHEYGLPYCFINSIINTGIDRPKQYSQEIIGQIVDGVENGVILQASDISPTEQPKVTPSADASTPTPIPPKTPIDELDIPQTKATKKTPNIIMLQLESFFDPTSILGSTYTQDPIPNFRYLKEKFTSGYLNVPSVGAGTANTEFEAITGMNLDFFGPGEYPYKTILQQTTSESIGYNLKPLGYKTHALHNNDGTFYGRNTVFAQLGFDTFTSIEYMENIELTPLGWAKDSILTDEIRKILESTDAQDFIYAISVQGHGAYPSDPLLEQPEVDLTLPEEFSEETYYGLLYYINELHEMDHFIGELVSYLEQCGEPTVLVMYGDHLPSFSLTPEQLANGSLFQTEYVFWSNFPLEKEQQDLEAYQLYSYIFERLDIKEGLIPKLHRTQKDSDIYLEQLKMLEYDMLYGELDCYGGVNPFKPTDLQMGTTPASIYNYRLSASEEDPTTYRLYIVGDYFNTYSRLCINGTPADKTQLESRNLLFAEDLSLKVGDKISIAQIGKDGKILSTTNELTITLPASPSLAPQGVTLTPEPSFAPKQETTASGSPAISE